MAKVRVIKPMALGQTVHPVGLELEQRQEQMESWVADGFCEWCEDEKPKRTRSKHKDMKPADGEDGYIHKDMKPE